MAETLLKEPVKMIKFLLEDSDDEGQFEDYPFAESKYIQASHKVAVYSKSSRTVSFSPKQTVITFEKYLKTPPRRARGRGKDQEIQEQFFG
jgi:hypothetical protein